MPGRSVSTRCPHCARPLAGLDLTYDHIISEALGGRSKVPACKPCNDALGQHVEGPLLRPGSVLTLLAQVAGTTIGKLHGGFSEGPLAGRGATVDFRTGEHRLRTCVEDIDNTDGTSTFTVGGSSVEVRKILDGLGRRHGAQVPAWDALTNEQRTPVPPALIEMALELDLVLLRRLVAKSGLCAGAWVWGDAFVDTPVADWLREVLDVRRDWHPGRKSTVADPEVTGVLEEPYVDAAGLLDRIGRMVPGAQSLSDTTAYRGQVVFVPLRHQGQQCTVVMLTVLGWHLPVSLVAPYPIPSGHGFPVAVCQPRDKAAELLDVGQLMLEQIAGS